MLQKIKNIVSFFPVIGLLLLVGSLPFHYGWFQRISLYIIAVAYPIDYICNQRWKSWKWTNQKWIYVLFICAFLLPLIWQCFDDCITPIFSKTLNYYFPFFFFGICGIIGTTDKLRVEYVSCTMLITSVAIIIYIFTLFDLFEISNFQRWSSQFNLLSHQHINSHMVLNLYWNFSIILGFFFISYSNTSKWFKGVIVLLMMIVLLALCMTDGRTGLLSLIGVILISILQYMLKHRKWWMTIIVLGTIVCSYGFLLQKERFVNATTETNPRIYIWDVALDMIKERPVLGYGVCSARAEFVERGIADEQFYNKYAKCLIQELESKNQNVNLAMMHSHNAILEIWIQFGMIGVLLLCCIFILILKMHLGHCQFFLNLCLFVFLMQAMFESLGANLQPMYICMMVLLWHYHYINSIRLPS